ncbi:MAG: hypothetical protein WBB37_01015 [bacterium]
MVISYHPHNTYQNPAAVAREAFYNTGLTTPFVIFNGTHVVWEQSPANYVSVFRQAVEIGRTDLTFFDLEVDSITSDSMTGSFHLRIIATFTVPERDINTYIAVLEDSLPGAYTTFISVCDTLYDFPLEIAYQDTFDTTITFEHSIEPNRMRAVIFVQDMDSLYVYAAKRIQFTADTVLSILRSGSVK